MLALESILVSGLITSWFSEYYYSTLVFFFLAGLNISELTVDFGV